MLTVVMVLGLIGCAADEPDTIAPDPPATENGGTGGDAVLPDADPALVLVETKCSQCHTLAQVWAQDLDRAGWEAIVTRMETNGLQVTAEEREMIIEYLAEN